MIDSISITIIIHITKSYHSLKDENHSCTTPALSNIDDYKRNVDGDIEAQLELKYLYAGNEVNVFPFKIYFELAPYIEYAVIEEIEDEYPYPSYNAYYRVKYKGAEKVSVYVEEEFGTDVRVTSVNEPFIATGVAKHIKSPYYAWIDFEVKNKYGKNIYTIELQPYGVVSPKKKLSSESLLRTSNHKIDLNLINENEKIEVYDTSGRFITSLYNISDVETLNVTGLLILHHINRNGDVTTSKLWEK